jgi:membrane protein required for colicin V production
VNWVTLVLVVVIGLLTWRSYSTGFIRELVSLASVILAVPVAGIFYDDMYPKVHPIVDSVALANLISFMSLLAGVVIAGQIASYLLRETANALNLGEADHLAGAAFGLIKGILLCQVVLIALVAFPKPDIRDEIDRSPVATALLDSTPLVLSILPSNFDAQVDFFLDHFSDDGDDDDQSPG